MFFPAAVLQIKTKPEYAFATGVEEERVTEYVSKGRFTLAGHMGIPTLKATAESKALKTAEIA